jgi:hypothetical protein
VQAASPSLTALHCSSIPTKPLTSIININVPSYMLPSGVLVRDTRVFRPINWRPLYRAFHGRSPISSPHERELLAISSEGPYPWEPVQSEDMRLHTFTPIQVTS